MIDKKQIPPSWEVVKLGEVCEFEYGKGLTKENRDENGKINVYGSNGVVGKHSSFLIDEPCLIVGRKGAAGEVHLSLEPCYPIDTTYFVRKPKLYDLKYFFYCLKNLRLDSLEKSTAIPGLNRNDAYAKEIPLPPFPEQHRIVSKIEELFSELDKGIESLKTAQQQLKVYRQAVLKWAFEGKLTHEDVILSKLGEHCDLITKGASPRWQGFNYIDDESQLLFVTSENIRENFIDVSEPKYLSLEFNNIQKRSILKKEDVLFNLVGASIGRAAIFNLDKITNINQAVAIIRLKESIFNKYLSYFLNSEVAKQKYLEKIVDVARANLSLTDVANIQIPLPQKIEQQNQIVQEIETRLSVCDKLEETITTALQQSEALRQSILKKAFEGKLVAQDPEDEPASKSLEIIVVEMVKNENAKIPKG